MRENFDVMWKCIKERKGADKVLEYLEKSDFFTAPASTRFHNAFKGGLLAHSIGVANKLSDLSDDNKIKWQRPESPIVIGLLHDICKTHFYQVDFKNVKNNESGKWESVEYYRVEEKMPFGIHGDKSVMLLLQLGFELTSEEVYCIRYHMGAYEGMDVINSLSSAIRKCPNILWVQMADMLESIEEEKRNV